MLRHLFLVGYDVTCETRRSRVLRALKANAIGGQKSFYECWFTSGEMQTALHELSGLIDPEEDRIVFIRLDPRAVIRTLGQAVAPASGDYFYFG
jgi:CRISPR-associated protein Cas2